jgi:hypothetical protein
MPFKEIIVIFSQNNTKPMNTLCGQNAQLRTIKARGIGTYNYHKVLNG